MTASYAMHRARHVNVWRSVNVGRSLNVGRSVRNGVDVVLAVGAVAAVGAVVEAAIIPGVLIGALVIVPRLLQKPRRRERRAGRSFAMDLAGSSSRGSRGLIASPAGTLQLKEATLKTISFRLIVTVLDFGFNYVVLGDLVTSAGLSVFSFVAGPFFYFLHETSWTYMRPLLPADWTVGGARGPYKVGGVSISHAVAKTITYRLFATVSEFSTNLIVVQNLATAAYLTSFGFFIGPFVYYAHERLWETLDARSKGNDGSPVPVSSPPAIAWGPA